MQIVLHVNRYFDWEPVPADVNVTKADEAAGRVKPAQNGHLMKVEKSANTHTVINIPESELQETLVAEFTRGDKQPMTREQLAHRYATRHHLDHNTHPDWIEEVEVHDDGPDEAGLRALLAKHVNAINPKTGQANIQARDVDRIVAKYMQSSSDQSHVDHLHQMYGVTPERISASQDRRAKERDAAAAAHDAHLTNIAQVASNGSLDVDPAQRAADDKRFAEAVAASKSKQNKETN